ncbi:MAG: glycosyltransferase [Candidatus Omnitrophota bacterium]
MPKLSVVIPTYNCSKYLPDAIDSVLRQKYQDCEVLIIDDGSKDDTRNVLVSYIEKKLIKYFYQGNQGPGAARNKGISVAKGDYISFLDADDKLLQNSLLEKCILLDRFPEVALTFSDYFLSFEENLPSIGRLSSQRFLSFFKDVISYKDDYRYIFNPFFYYKYITFPVWAIWTGTVMMRKDVVSNIGLFRTDTSHAEDAEYWLRVAKDYRIGFINKPLSVYKRNRSVLTNDRENYFLGGIESRLKILNCELKNKNCPPSIIFKLKNKISKEYSEFGRHYLRSFEIKKSRFAFLNALKFNRLSFTSYAFIFISLLPIYFQKKLKNIRKKIRKLIT